MKPLAAAWALVSHPLRVGRGWQPYYDDHGARHATKSARRVWWVLTLIPAAIWAALGVWRMFDGEPVLGVAYVFGSLALVMTQISVRTQYLSGYMRGSIQAGIDARARAVGRPFDVTARALPHPADPMADLARLYGTRDVIDDDER
jgi:hypothetical protein